MLWSGVLAYALCLFIAALDTEFLTYWSALVLLGIGWNFLFLSGTNMLPHGYRPKERFRVQSANDFLVFSVQALASLGSGWFLNHWQWHGIVYACMPLLLVLFALLIVYRKTN
jgi:MFS family permease